MLPPSLPALRDFAGRMEVNVFRQAKSKRNPHAYTLLKTWSDRAAFYESVRFIRQHGFQEVFPPTRWGTTYTLLHANGWKYWSMGAPVKDTILINRKPATYHTDFCDIADAYDGMFEDASHKAETATAMKRVCVASGSRVLDVGAGTGTFLDHWSEKIDPLGYVAIDPSRPMTGRLVVKHPAYTDSVVPSRFEDYTGGDFDLMVSMFGSASYIEPRYLPRVRDMLAPGGRYFFMFYADGYEPVSCVTTGKDSHHFLPADSIAALCPDMTTAFEGFQICEGVV